MSGIITLSMEVELGWGVHDTGDYVHLSEDGAAERAYLSRLLDRCDELDVPISFNVVGHLCQSTCDGAHEGPHEPGWFDSDPGTDATADPLFYAPGMVQDILERPTDHELCTHTYSHVPCRVANPETVAWELERAQTQIETVTGSRTRSIVPPRHSRPPADALRDAGIEILRMGRDTSDCGSLARLKELVFGPHPTFEPAVVDGIRETYCTTYPSLTSSALPDGQRPAPAYFRGLPVRTRQSLQRQYLRRAAADAVERDESVHLWCHLYDLANRYQWPVVEAFLGHLATLRERGDVEVLTMARLNDRLKSEPAEEALRA